jgi:hypothetical protein
MEEISSSETGLKAGDRLALGLLFDLEDGGDMFLRNVDYTALYPRRWYSS